MKKKKIIMHIIHHSYKLLLKFNTLIYGSVIYLIQYNSFYKSMTVSGLTNFSVPKNLFLRKKSSPRYD